MRTSSLKSFSGKIKLIMVYVMMRNMKFDRSTMMTRREFLQLAVSFANCMKK